MISLNVFGQDADIENKGHLVPLLVGKATTFDIEPISRIEDLLQNHSVCPIN